MPGNALADIVARCANLSFLSVPASCGAGMSDEEIAEIWSAALAGCASSLETLCFQVPVTTTALLLIVSGRGGEFPGLETLSVAMRVAAGGDGEPPIDAGNVADDLVAATSPCPAIRTLTLVDPPPELPTSVEEAAVTRAKMLASVELARARSRRGAGSPRRSRIRRSGGNSP